MSSFFSEQRADYIRTYRNFKHAVVKLVSSVDLDDRSRIVSEIAHDLARIEDSSQDAMSMRDDE